MKEFLKNITKLSIPYILNIIGLITAFMAFIIIILSIQNEFSYNKNIKNSNRIYRIELSIKAKYGSGIEPVFSYPMAQDIINSSSDIESGTVICSYYSNTHYTVNIKNEKIGYKDDFMACDRNFIRTFGLDIIAGNSKPFEAPENVIIPESIAIKLFGNSQNAIGQTINMTKSWLTKLDKFSITAVYKDLPENCTLTNSIYFIISNKGFIEDWGSHNVYTYLKLNKSSSHNINKILDNYKKKIKSKLDNEDFINEAFSYTAFEDIYYSHKCNFDDITKHGNKSSTYILLSIALLILLLASINFTNFSMAVVPFKIKAINIKKVLGENNKSLRYHIILDSIYLLNFSMIIALILVYLISRMSFSYSIFSNINLGNQYIFIIGCLFGSIILGALISIFPSKYMTSFSPAIVLKGSFGLSSHGLLLRKILVSIQFIISISLIASSLFIQKQNSFMSNADLGFNKDNLLVLEINKELARNNLPLIENSLNKIPDIEGVGFCQDKICSKDIYSMQGYFINGHVKQFTSINCSWNLPKVLGVKLLEGEYLTSRNHYKEIRSVIMNETAKKTYQCSLEDNYTIWKTPIKLNAIMEDIRVLSMRGQASPMLFWIPPYHDSSYYPYQFAYIRYNKNSSPINLIKKIKDTMYSIDPYFTFNIEDFDNIIEARYKTETNFGKAINLFSILAIIISLIGILGLILFDTLQRKKELAIRRIHGANEINIIIKFSKPYLIMIGICSIISIPIIIYVMKLWLDKFAYKIDLSPWIFLVAILIALVLTLIVIIYQVKTALHKNPINSIKPE